MTELREAVAEAAEKLFSTKVEVVLERPAEQFGDYSTNVAMQLAGQLKQNPKELAEKLAEEIQKLDFVETAEVAGPGFINIKLTDETLLKSLDAKASEPLKDQEILVEFGDPNPFKEMHIGHLYSYVVGDSLCRLLESQGATVRRLSYHGDVGLHVAKALWGMQHGGEGSVGELYAKGAQAYETDEKAKAEIDELNTKIYEQDDSIKQFYEAGRKASFKEFDQILNMLSIKTDRRYLESEAAEPGLQLVKANIGKVFEESGGAVVYKGEQDGLHTRVFITSKSLPTYETKDLGLAELKDKDYPKAERSIYVTAHEQAEYFKVMLAALSKIRPQLEAKITHISHGFVNLSTGKMSSRKGEVFTAAKLLADVTAAAKKAFDKSNPSLELGAVKYGFLKHRLGQDITYNPAETVSLQGDSGPYLQYAHARARSILAKAQKENPESRIQNPELEAAERSLARKISEFPEIVEAAAAELLPSHICTYLYELAQNFNRFYEKNRVVGDKRQAVRLALVEKYADVLKRGLELLGITAPEHI